MNFSVSALMEGFEELFPKETSFAVADSKRFIYYKPSSKIDLQIKPGDEIKEDTVTYKALSVQQKISEHIHSKVFGIPYYGTSVPILNNGNPQGCITAILSTEQLRFLADYLTVRIGECWKPVPHKEIMFLEAQNRKTWVQSERGTGTNKFKLSELEYILPNDLFFRCHRSYIININYIAEIQPDSHSTFLLIMKDKSKVPVSQTYAKHFRKLLAF
ncbi:transcriptional regulator, LytTR family [Alteribacillus persepolensis]|uniref:Transcriptional regulator, LytTR family n=1 Tax=Alteribacillus persepolensis TaxID=568899 RepID=A0A1G8GVX6_9BACI|nr:transcriptional regulator, LytTR family [Alteribacillus persepolensis]